MNTISLVFQNFVDIVVCTYNHGRALTEREFFHPRRFHCRDAFFTCFFPSQAFFFSNPPRHRASYSHRGPSYSPRALPRAPSPRAPTQVTSTSTAPASQLSH